MIIGFTGTQKGMNPLQILAIRKFMYKEMITEAHHGDCIGADSQFHTICREFGNIIHIIIHPPINEDKRAFCTGDEIRPAKEYLKRNLDIILESDILIAAPNTFDSRLRSGTWSTIRKAIKLNKPLMIIYPDGIVKNINIILKTF